MKTADKGAAALASQLEAHAADAEKNIHQIKAEIAKLVDEISRVDGSDEQERRLKDSLSDRRGELNDAFDHLLKLARSVREYDKQVDQSRREGEKISVVEAAEFFAQFWLSAKLAIESYILTMSAESARCNSELEFHKAHAEQIRSAFMAAIQRAINDGKLPKWAMIDL